MKLRIALFFPALLLIAAACACGGKSPAGIDPGKVPTATLPANLPEPIIISGTPTRPAQVSGRTYTVVSGDSLSAIADKLGTTVDELIAANGLTSNDLSVGQVLKIPASSTATSGTTTPAPSGTTTPTPNATTETPTTAPETTETPEPASTATTAAGQNTYTVQSGDNASDIAQRFGVTVDELAAANHKTVDDLRSLQVGDVLIIPPPSTTPEPAATTAPPEDTSVPPEDTPAG